jgi:hypothetical protein
VTHNLNTRFGVALADKLHHSQSIANQILLGELCLIFALMSAVPSVVKSIYNRVRSHLGSERGEGHSGVTGAMQAYVEVASFSSPIERDLIFNHLSCIEKVRPRQRIVLTFKTLDSREVGGRQLWMEDMRLVPFFANLGLRIRS